ncbi:MAG: hypothetical protein PHT91_02130, partial [Candidatus Nanoarchaeia archaeon]|nr:hypothetical protein [Candidatus Nanoarchaeia archaeon]
MIKKLFFAIALFLMIAEGFGATGHYVFNRMNGTVYTIDNEIKADIPITLSCNVIGDPNVYAFNTMTNINGIYSFEGKNATFSDYYGETTVTCALSSSNPEVFNKYPYNAENNNENYVFEIWNGVINFPVGATHNLTHYSLVSLPQISMISPEEAIGINSTEVIIEMAYAQSCIINGINSQRINESNYFSAQINLSHGNNDVFSICQTVTGTEVFLETQIFADIQPPIIELINPDSFESVSGFDSINLTISATDDSSFSCYVNGDVMDYAGNDTYSLNVNLSHGNNSFNVSCIDEFNHSTD